MIDYSINAARYNVYSNTFNKKKNYFEKKNK